MKVVTAPEMREIDRITIQERGFPDAVLMGLAGKAVADQIRGFLPGLKRAAVFCGSGNNGGDGYVAAYFLENSGIPTDIFQVGEKNSETSSIYRSLCKNSGIEIKIIRSADDLAVLDLDGYGCVIDALLGTGSSSAPRGVIADAIRVINDSDAFVAAIDVPSGLGSDGAAPEGEAVVADCTITIGLPKLSLVTYPGRDYTGELRVADIGFPLSLAGSDDLKTELIDRDYFNRNAIGEIESDYCLRADTHKSARGNLLLVGGFSGMEGACLMAARSAFETGVGLACMLTTKEARPSIAGIVPELITTALPFAIDDANPEPEQLMRTINATLEAKRYDALIIGPGMGRSVLARSVFECLIGAIGRFSIKRVLIDGDGLYHLADFLESGKLERSVDWIITPHFMEASRLLGAPVEHIRNNRHKSAGDLARKTECVVVLKGPSSIVTDGTRYLINTTGGPSLATAGSGDVLSGIIGSLTLRRLTALQAAAAGTWIHGKAADLFCSDTGYDIMKSTDLIAKIRSAKKSI